MVEPYYIKDVQKQPFADVLQNRCSCKFWKICKKTPMLESLSKKVARLKTPSKVFSHDFCEIFKNIYFLTTPQNQTTLQCKQINITEIVPRVFIDI